jgi:hypothetical protein
MLIIVTAVPRRHLQIVDIVLSLTARVPESTQGAEIAKLVKGCIDLIGEAWPQGSEKLGSRHGEEMLFGIDA